MSDQKFESVWDALEDDPIKAQSLKLRSELAIIITAKLKGMGLRQEEAAKFLGITQPRVSALVNGKVNQFRLDMLVDIALRMNMHVTLHAA